MMESREMIMPLPAEETKAPEAPSSYELGLNTQTANPSQMMGPHDSSLAKKKRGRPRKYGPGPDGMAQTLWPMPLSGSGGEKKKRKRKMYSSDMSLGDQVTSGGSFTPHMVTVNPGEDVTSKIISFSKYGPRAICVLSALGIISHVTLRQANSSGGTVTYEGRFEILSLSGCFTPGDEEVGGGMSIALSSPDGRVVGGLLAGLLTAAAPVQVVVASFLPPHDPKPKNAIKLSNLNEQSPTPGNTNSTPAHHQNQSSVLDWRRTATDMNVSLREQDSC